MKKRKVCWPRCLPTQSHTLLLDQPLTLATPEAPTSEAQEPVCQTSKASFSITKEATGVLNSHPIVITLTALGLGRAAASPSGLSCRPVEGARVEVIP